MELTVTGGLPAAPAMPIPDQDPLPVQQMSVQQGLPRSPPTDSAAAVQPAWVPQQWPDQPWQAHSSGRASRSRNGRSSCQPGYGQPMTGPAPTWAAAPAVSRRAGRGGRQAHVRALPGPWTSSSA